MFLKQTFLGTKFVGQKKIWGAFLPNALRGYGLCIISFAFL